MTRLVEGNSHPGNSLTGDNLPKPNFCPLCGGALKEWSWVTVDKDYEYPSLVCYGAPTGGFTLKIGPFRLPIRVAKFAKNNPLYPTTPTAAHYQYQLPMKDLRGILSSQAPFDRMTGERL